MSSFPSNSEILKRMADLGDVMKAPKLPSSLKASLRHKMKVEASLVVVLTKIASNISRNQSDGNNEDKLLLPFARTSGTLAVKELFYW